MDIELLRSFLGWCALINFGILIFWFLMIKFTRKMVLDLHGKFLNISEEQFNLVQYQAMAFFKLSIFLFFLVPYIVLQIVT